MAATIGNLFINLKANSAPLQAGLMKSRASVSKFSKSMAAMRAGVARAGRKFMLFGAIAAAAMLLVVKRTMTSIDEMSKMANVLGLTNQEMREFAHITALAGIETKFAQKSLLNLIRSTAEVANGTGAAKDAFKLLGIEAREMALQTPMEMINTLSDALSKVKSQTDRVLIGYRLFGTRGIQMVNMLQEGSAALDAQRERFKMLAGVLTDEAARGVEEANDAMTRLKAFFEGVTTIVVAHFAPALTLIVDKLSTWVASVGGAGQISVKVFAAIASSVAFVADVLQYLVLGLRTIAVSIRAVAGLWINGWAYMGQGFASFIALFDEEWGKFAQGVVDDIHLIGDAMRNEAKADFDSILDDAAGPSWGDRIETFTDGLLESMKAAQGTSEAVEGITTSTQVMSEAMENATISAQKFIDSLDVRMRTFGMTSDMAKISEMERAGVDPKLIQQMRARATFLEMAESAKTAGEDTTRAVQTRGVETAIGSATFAFGTKKVDPVQQKQLDAQNASKASLDTLIKIGKQQVDAITDAFGGIFT